MDWSNVCVAGGAVTASVTRHHNIEALVHGGIGVARPAGEDDDAMEALDEDEDFENDLDNDPTVTSKDTEQKSQRDSDSDFETVDPKDAHDSYQTAIRQRFFTRPRNGNDPNLNSNILSYIHSYVPNFSFLSQWCRT